MLQKQLAIRFMPSALSLDLKEKVRPTPLCLKICQNKQLTIVVKSKSIQFSERVISILLRWVKVAKRLDTWFKTVIWVNTRSETTFLLQVHNRVFKWHHGASLVCGATSSPILKITWMDLKLLKIIWLQLITGITQSQRLKRQCSNTLFGSHTSTTWNNMTSTINISPDSKLLIGLNS